MTEYRRMTSKDLKEAAANGDDGAQQEIDRRADRRAQKRAEHREAMEDMSDSTDSLMSGDQF